MKSLDNLLNLSKKRNVIDVKIFGTLLHLFSKLGNVKTCEELIERMEKVNIMPDVICLNEVLFAYANCKRKNEHKHEKIIVWYNRIVDPNAQTYKALVDALSAFRQPHLAKDILFEALR